jgi:hypothetical protein
MYGSVLFDWEDWDREIKKECVCLFHGEQRETDEREFVVECGNEKRIELTV